jgi:hypothetical protein
MAKFGIAAKIAVISAVLYIIVGYKVTYEQTQKVLGPMVGQPEPADYGEGYDFKNYGFLIHAVVMGALMYLVLRYGLKL